MSCGSAIPTPDISSMQPTFARPRLRKIVLLALALGMAALQPARADMVGFANVSAGAAPQDFELGRTGSGGPGKWAVVEDDTAEGGRALEQSSAEKTDYRFPLAIYK